MSASPSLRACVCRGGGGGAAGAAFPAVVVAWGGGDRRLLGALGPACGPSRLLPTPVLKLGVAAWNSSLHRHSKQRGDRPLAPRPQVASESWPFGRGRGWCCLAVTALLGGACRPTVVPPRERSLPAGAPDGLLLRRARS